MLNFGVGPKYAQFLGKKGPKYRPKMLNFGPKFDQNQAGECLIFFQNRPKIA
jgi:hypothetical protein